MREPEAILEGRVRLSRGAKARVALRSLCAGREPDDVVVDRRRLAGIAAALDCAEAGRAVTLVEVRRASGVPPTRSSATAWSSTTASTCSCAAAPPTGSCSAGSAASRRRAPAATRDSGARPGEPAAVLPAAGCRRRAPGARAAALPPSVAARAARALDAPRSHSVASIQAATTRRSAPGWSDHGQTTRGNREPLGPDRAADTEPAGGRGLARARRVRLPGGPAASAGAGDIGIHRAPLSEIMGAQRRARWRPPAWRSPAAGERWGSSEPARASPSTASRSASRQTASFSRYRISGRLRWFHTS